MNEYTLPSLETIAGVFSIKLFSEFAGLTVPTNQTITGIGDLEETADIDIGVTQLGTLQLLLKEDYTNYTEGFWYKVLAGECWLRFYLDESAGDTFYFFGMPQEDTVEWVEHFLGNNEYLRTASLDLISMAFKLFDTLVSDWVTAVKAQEQSLTPPFVEGQPVKLVHIRNVFAAMVKASGLNTTHSLNDVTFVSGTSADFIYTEGGNEYDFNDLWISTAYDALGGPYTGGSYFYDTTPQSDITKYYTRLDALLPLLLKNFGLVLRMTYDSSTQRHGMQLIQRGRAYSALLAFDGREKRSVIRKSSDLLGDAVSAEKLLAFDGAGNKEPPARIYYSRKFTNGQPTDVEPDENGNYEFPKEVEFDVQTTIIFGVREYSTAAYNFGHDLYVWSTVVTEPAVRLTGIKYFNYDPAVYDYVTASVAERKMEEAVAGYIYNRFTNKYTQVTRTYGKLNASNGSTDSHANASILQRTSIDDGTGAANFYANKVKKSIERNELEIEWIKE